MDRFLRIRTPHGFTRPAQLYSVAFALIAFVIALRLLRDRERPDGQVFAFFFAGYSLWRLLLFPLRDDPGAPLLLNLAASQLWSIAAIVTALALWPRRHRAEEGAALPSVA